MELEHPEVGVVQAQISGKTEVVLGPHPLLSFHLIVPNGHVTQYNAIIKLTCNFFILLSVNCCKLFNCVFNSLFSETKD